jgi:peptidyl-prolyl cis-trans isomerase C
MLFSCSGEEKKGGTLTEGVAAVVNGESILMTQVDQVVAQWRKSPNPPADMGLPITELRKNALDQLVDRILLYQEAVKKGHEADSTQVDARIQQFRSQFPTQEAQDRALGPLGVDLEGLKRIYWQDLSIQAYIQRDVVPSIDVSEEACQQYFDANQSQFQAGEKVHARHILFLVDEAATPEEETEVSTRALQILERAQKGEDFTKLAAEHSEGPSGPRGGDLGYFERGQMVPPFEAAAFSLKVGEVSDLVRTQFGFHIIKVEDRQEGTDVPFDSAAPRIRSFLQQQGVNDRLAALVQELKQGADIQTNL